jgi:predicted permease
MPDIRDAIRALRASPLVSAAAIASLALGIGANTAIFTILDSLLLKPLPVQEPQRLVALASERAGEYASMTYPVWRELRDRRVLHGSFVWASDRVAGTDASAPVPLDAIWASGDFFDRLGVSAIAGRPFTRADDIRDGGSGGPVAVVSSGFARRRFGASASAIGQRIAIERVPYTVIGVMDPSFSGLEIGGGFDVILPLETEPLLNRIPSRVNSELWPWLRIMARLEPGETADRATAIVRAAQPQIRDVTMPDYSRVQDRDSYLKEPWTMMPAGTGTSRLRSRYAKALTSLMAIVGLVLLVACANIANLQLARATARRYEFSVRSALGASRGRIVRQLLIESLAIAALGALLGLAFAQWGSRVLVAQLSTWYQAASLDLTPDWRVLAVTAALTVATAVLFGTAPALRAGRAAPIDALKQRSSLERGSIGTAGWLVVAQIALSLVLVVSAGLFLRSFRALAFRDLGFDRARVLVAVVDTRRSATDPQGRQPLLERVQEAAGTAGGVERAALSMATPLGNAGLRFTEDVTVGNAPARVFTAPVSPGWFATFGTRLIAGRDFSTADRQGAGEVAIVNDAFARRYFPNANPIGQSLISRPPDAPAHSLEIVGLVENAAFTSVRDPIEPTMYRPFAQKVDARVLKASPTVSISTRLAPGAAPARVADSVAAAINRVDSRLDVAFITVDAQLQANYVRERLLAMVSGFFGAIAVLLAAIGLYGVTAYAVGRRRIELGIRMALGAEPGAVVRLIVGRVVLLTAVGVIAGTMATIWASRLVRTLLYGIDAQDPATIAGAVAVIAIVGLVAGWLPARRAARIEPAAVLRQG